MNPSASLAHHDHPTPLQPCHPPLALAPRRLYTSPMRNPTSACPHLPDAARGTSQRNRNCPESGPPCPKNGSWWTGRIVSAADGFAADSFPKIEKLGGGTNRRSSARPQGPSPRRACLGGPTLPRWPAARTRAAPPRRATPQPSPHMAVAPATRRAATRVKPRRRCQGGLPPKNNQRAKPCRSYRESPPSKQSTLCVPSRFRRRKKKTNYPPNYNNQTACCRRRPPAPPLLCSALQCPKPQPRDTGSPLEHYGDPCTTVIPAPTRRGGPATLPPQGRRASDRECDVMGPTR